MSLLKAEVLKIVNVNTSLLESRPLSKNRASVNLDLIARVIEVLNDVRECYVGNDLFCDNLPLLDLKHPDLGMVVSESLCEEILELVKTYRNIKEIKSDKIKRKIMATLISLYREIGLSKLFVGDNNARFISDISVRNSIRNNFGVKSIVLTGIYKKGVHNVVFDSFVPFIRFGDGISSQLDEAQYRIDVYTKNGYEGLVKEATTALNSLKSMNTDYYGFRRISLGLAATIMAFNHKVSFNHNYNQFFVEGLKYSAKAFCIDSIYNHLNDQSKKLIHGFDHFDCAGGKPIFDNFFVLVPSHLSKDNKPCSEKIDFENITHQRVCPALFGIANNSVYFINYLV